MKIKESKKIRELKHKTRRNSIKESLFASASYTVMDSYIPPFTIAINASNSVVAMISSIFGLLGPLSEIFGSRLLEKYPRKKIWLTDVLLESLMWIPFILIGFLFYQGIFIEALPFLLLIIYALFTIIYHLGFPAWFSWMGDIVDEQYRGRWFAKRRLIWGVSTIITAISAAVLLDYLEKDNLTMLGFMLLFVLAMIFRLICRQILKKGYDPKLKIKKKDYFSFPEFVIKAPETNFGRFSIFKALIGFATFIASPLVTVYLLRYLNFSYTMYMAIILSEIVFSLLLIELWGKFADKYGNYRVMVITTLFIPLVPILWILSDNPFYLIFVPSLIGGISWGGFELAGKNFIYDNVSKEKRAIAVSYSRMLWGAGVFLGAGLGAFLIKFLNTSFIEPLFAIFILSALARMIVVFWGIPKFKEIRKTQKFNSSKALKHILFKEAKPTIIHEFRDIIEIKKYFR